MDSRRRPRARPALIESARSLFFALFLSLLFTPFAAADAVTTVPAGSFRNFEPLTATYSFGWSAFAAADAEFSVSTTNEAINFNGKVATAGFVRALWKLDGTLHSSLLSPTLLPASSRIAEHYSSESRVTDLTFGQHSVIRRRVERPGPVRPTEKTFKLARATDLFGAIMNIQSQRLQIGDVYELLVFAKDSPYRALVTVEERERLTVGAGTYPAIRLSLRLQQVDKKGRLLPAKKFKSAQAWLSDDRHRLLLKVKSEVFVGAVWAELQTVKFAG